MSEQLRKFGIPFRIYNKDQIFQVSCDWLEEPALYTVFFVTAKQCIPLSEAKALLDKREQIIWIPGDEAVCSLFSKKERHEMLELSVEGYIMNICEYAADMGLDICFLMEDKTELEFVTEGIRKNYPYLAIHGLTLDSMNSAEMMINEINSIAPEILIMGVHTSEIRRYLEYDRNKTNARLCICVGNLLITEMSKKHKMLHTITMSRVLKKQLHKYNSMKEQS